MTLDHLRKINNFEQNPSNEQELHQDLVKGYGIQCRRIWHTYPKEDIYYYCFLIDHAIKGKANEIIKEILRDYHWMTAKISIVDDLRFITRDIRSCINYFDAKGSQVNLLNRLLSQS